MIPVLPSAGPAQCGLCAILPRVLVTAGNPPAPQCRMSPEEDLHKIEDILNIFIHHVRAKQLQLQHY